MRPHPRIRKTIKWGGAAVTVLLVAVWIGSGWWWVSFVGTNGVGCAVGSGLLRFSFEKGNMASFAPGWAVEGNAPSENPSVRFQSRFAWAFDHYTVYSASTGGMAGVAQSSTLDGYDIPQWVLILASLIASVTAWRLDALAHRRAKRNLCPKCSYDRSGLAKDAVCPECGAAPGSKPTESASHA